MGGGGGGGGSRGFTTIKAIVNGTVTIDGGFTSDYTRMLHFDSNESYVNVEGLFFWRTNLYLGGATFIYVKNCGVAETSDTTQGQYNFGVGENSSDILIEDCYAFGQGRYFFGVSSTGGTRIVFRRCVARLDFSYLTNQYIAGFVNYAQTDVAFENCIVIDSLSYVYSDGTPTIGFMGPNGSNDTEILGSMVLNHIGSAVHFESTPTDLTASDLILWDIKNSTASADRLFWTKIDDGSTAINNSTFGNSAIERGIHHDSGSGSTVTDTIIYNVDTSASYEANADYTANYVNFYANTYDGSIGTNSLSIDPTSNGLLYLPRIESGSTLATAGSSGGRVGADMTKQIGVTGTFYGDTDWDITTDNALWPWENEDVIKEKMAAYNLHSINGARGFAASGKQLNGTDDITLTSYVWEYLGNQMPSDIYGRDGGQVNAIPTSSIAVNSAIGTMPFLVNFDGTGNDVDGQINSYLWQFGDGQASSVEDPSHTYSVAGNYTASLTVTDNYGASSIPAVMSIVVLPDSVIGAENTFFVNSATGSDASIGTSEYPWRTMQHAIDQVSEGTIYVVNTGTPYEPIKFVNKSNVTLQGLNGVPEIQGTQYDDGRQVSVVITESSNIILDNIDINPNATIAASNNIGVRMYGGVDHITIKNCELRNAGERNIMTSSNSNYLTLENNNIHDSLGGHCVYFSNGGHDYVVRGNTFDSCNSAGMQFNGDGRYMYNILLEKNTFSNNASGSNTVGSDTAAEALAFVEVYDVIAKNNVFYDNLNKGLDVYSDSSDSHDVKIYNNTFYVHNDTGRPAIQVKLDSSYSVSVVNNLIVNQDVENIDSGSNMITRDNEEDLFVSSFPVSATDLMLKVGSLAIDKGVDLTSENVVSDIFSNIRPQGAAYDLGAYEYSPSGATLILPAGNLKIQ